MFRGEQNNPAVHIEMLQTQTAHRGAVGVDDMCQEPFLDPMSTVDEDGVPYQEAHSADSLLGMFLVLLFVLLIKILLENISLICRYHYCWLKVAKFRPMLGTVGL